MSDPYIGEIRPFALMSFTPAGWLFCDGSKVSIQQYQVLYAVIGDTYGPSDYKTYFTLPNLMGSATAGWGSAIPPEWAGHSNPGSSFGVNAVTATMGNMPPHNHTLSFAAAAPAVPMQPNAGNTAIPFRPYNTTAKKTSSGWSTANPGSYMMANNSLNPAGAASTAAHENRQPFMAFRFAIATEGIFPVRE